MIIPCSDGHGARSPLAARAGSRDEGCNTRVTLLPPGWRHGSPAPGSLAQAALRRRRSRSRCCSCSRCGTSVAAQRLRRLPSSRPCASRAAKPAAAKLLVVDVAGDVRRPGLYDCASGSRVDDAIAAAGGATRKAQLDAVNLAAPVADGEQIVVPEAARAASRRLPPLPAPRRPRRSISTRRRSSSSRRCPGSGR